MACGSAFGIGIDDFAAGEHTGQKRLTSRRTFRHSAMRRPYRLFQIRSTAYRYDASSTVSSSMTDSRSPASALGTFQGFGQPAHDHAMGPAMSVAMTN